MRRSSRQAGPSFACRSRRGVTNRASRCASSVASLSSRGEEAVFPFWHHFAPFCSFFPVSRFFLSVRRHAAHACIRGSQLCTFDHFHRYRRSLMLVGDFCGFLMLFRFLSGFLWCPEVSGRVFATFLHFSAIFPVSVHLCPRADFLHREVRV